MAQRSLKKIDTGDVVAEIDQPRKLQNYGSGSCLYANLSKFGRDFHDLEKGSQVSVVVCENGIWFGLDR